MCHTEFCGADHEMKGFFLFFFLNKKREKELASAEVELILSCDYYAD